MEAVCVGHNQCVVKRDIISLCEQMENDGKYRKTRRLWLIESGIQDFATVDGMSYYVCHPEHFEMLLYQYIESIDTLICVI